MFRVSAAIDDPEHRARALAGAAHLLEGSARARAFDEALQAATAISSKWEMEHELGNLARSLDHAQLDRALDATIAASNTSGQGLINLALFLTPGQLDRVLAAATAIKWESERGRALSGLARYLDPDQLQRALDAASNIAGEGTRAIAQVRIVITPTLPCPAISWRAR